MATDLIKVPFGKDPINFGDYDALVAQGKTSFGVLNRVNRYGCEFESLYDNNTEPPAVWDGGDQITISDQWRLTLGNPETWLLSLDKPAADQEHPNIGMGRVTLKPKYDQENPYYVNQSDFEDGEGNPLVNTVFVIKYDFVLSEDITVPANCVLEFDGGSITKTTGTNYTIDLNDADIIAGFYNIFKNIIFSGTYKKTFNAVWAGIETSATNNADIINHLIEHMVYIFIPAGSYELNSQLVIESSAAVNVLYGEYNKKDNRTNFSVQGCNGIVVKKSRVTIEKLAFYGNGACVGTWSENDHKYIDGYYGLDMQAGCDIFDCWFNTFMIGINIASNNHVVTAAIKRTWTPYCGNAGLYILHHNNYQKNHILIEQLYAVKCGHNVDTPTADSTELYSGHGVWIKGGKSIVLLNCVLEWNSGVGLYIEGTNENQGLLGFSAIGNYYERNKYTQAYYYIPNSKHSLNNFYVCGSFFENYTGEKPTNASPMDKYIIYDYCLDNFHSQEYNSHDIRSINIEGFDYCKEISEAFNDSDFINNHIITGDEYEDDGYLNFTHAIRDGRTKVTLPPGIYTLCIFVKYKNINTYQNLMYSIMNTGTTRNTNIYLPQGEGFKQAATAIVVNKTLHNLYINGIYLNRAKVDGEYYKFKFEWHKAEAASTTDILALEHPAYGMTIYNSDISKQVLYNGSKWIVVADGSDMPT